MNIYPSITGNNARELMDKIEEAEEFGINEIPLFVQRLSESDRKSVYDRLKSSNIKEIPLVHIRNKMDLWELKFLKNEFNTTYFTIHESGFDYLEKWREDKGEIIK